MLPRSLLTKRRRQKVDYITFHSQLFLGDTLQNGSPNAVGPLSVLSCLYNLFCLFVCLSVTLVYCGQTVGWIKMKLGVQVGLGPGHIVI